MTIYALSSGPAVSGIAVVRISGPETSKAIELLTGKNVPKPRVATLGFGISFPVRDFMTFDASEPEILIIATPETPGPDDKA